MLLRPHLIMQFVLSIAWRDVLSRSQHFPIPVEWYPSTSGRKFEKLSKDAIELSTWSKYLKCRSLPWFTARANCGLNGKGRSQLQQQAWNAAVSLASGSAHLPESGASRKLLQETEPFCRWRLERVAKILPDALPKTLKDLGWASQARQNSTVAM